LFSGRVRPVRSVYREESVADREKKRGGAAGTKRKVCFLLFPDALAFFLRNPLPKGYIFHLYEHMLEK